MTQSSVFLEIDILEIHLKKLVFAPILVAFLRHHGSWETDVHHEINTPDRLVICSLDFTILASLHPERENPRVHSIILQNQLDRWIIDLDRTRD